MSRRPWGLIDLHAHSAVSDGTETPSALVMAASAAGLGTVAITDHDATSGWAEASATARDIGISLIPGMEFSTRNLGYSVHLLAYLFDPEDAALTAEMATIRAERFRRAEKIVERISMDYDLIWDDVLQHSTPGATIGRPHIADALIAKGHVVDRAEAFDSILHPRTPYYAPHYAPALRHAIELVRGAGGAPVLAHPATNTRGGLLPREVLADLVDAGLVGMEIDHRENTETGKTWLRELAGEFDLVVTGSSDWHGSGKPNVLGENTTSPEALERIIAVSVGSAPVIAG
jgi:predicted metal-dependent phosphoesterase TrpH